MYIFILYLVHLSNFKNIIHSVYILYDKSVMYLCHIYIYIFSLLIVLLLQLPTVFYYAYVVVANPPSHLVDVQEV